MVLANTTLAPGTVIDGRFQVVRMLGRGGYGEVYEALQLSMQRTVALKVLRPHLAGDHKVVARFQNEARFACRLTHPNTVIYFDFGFDEAQALLFLAMEYLEGQSLSQKLKSDGAMGLEGATQVLGQICGSLHEAHELGLIHRDIKPANIMLINRANISNYVKVIDFGIAKATDDYEGEVRRLTATGAILGTPHYMAPEQIRGGSALSPSTDVYALGCMVYKMLTGLTPFRGQSAIEVATQHLSTPAPRIQTLTQERLPSAIEALLKRTLDKNPAERPQSTLAFYEAWCEAIDVPSVMSLESDTLGDDEMDTGGPTTPFVQPIDHSATTLRKPEPPTQQHTRTGGWSRQQKRHLALLTMVCLAALVLVIAVGTLIYQDLNTPTHEAIATGPSPDVVDLEPEPESGSEAAAVEDPDVGPAAEPDAPEEKALERIGAEAIAAKDAPKAADKAPKRDPAVKVAEKTVEKAPAKTIEAAPKAVSPTEVIEKKPVGGLVQVSISVSPWGKVQVGGRTMTSPARVSLKPGTHTVRFGQRTISHSRVIRVSPEKTFFRLQVPAE